MHTTMLHTQRPHPFVSHCPIHCTLYTAHYTLHTIHCTLYTGHYTLHTIHCTLMTVFHTPPTTPAGGQLLQSIRVAREEPGGAGEELGGAGESPGNLIAAMRLGMTKYILVSPSWTLSTIITPCETRDHSTIWTGWYLSKSTCFGREFLCFCPWSQIKETHNLLFFAQTLE